jgi:adhesin transport system outer membrane protein
MQKRSATSPAAWLWSLSFLGSLFVAPGAAAAEQMTDQQRGLGLVQLIAQSIQNHPSVAAANAQLGAARAEIDTARAQYYPTPSAQVLQDKGQSTTTLALQQPLWAGGRIDAGLNAAQSRSNAAQVSISATQYLLALRVTAAWTAWLQAQGRGEVLGKGVALLNVYAESANRRIAGGIAGNTDRELVIARVSQTQADLDAAHSAQRNALARLAQLTGLTLRSQDISLAVVADGENFSLPSLEALRIQALMRSAALQRLEADLQTAHHEIQQKRAALWPTVSLRAQHQHNDAPGLRSNESSVLLVLDYSPGAGLSAGANIEAAQARLLALRDNLEASRRDLIETITADFEDHQSASERAHSIQRTIQSNAEVLASYDRLFVAGKQSWLDVMNAARELIQMQTTLVDVEAQRMAARARLRLHAGEML